MKKVVHKSFLFFFGLIIGAMISAWIVGNWSSDAHRAESILRIAELESIASKIYRSGDYKSTIIILKDLAKKLEQYEQASGDPGAFRTDRGLAHGRLYKIHHREGKEGLAEKEAGIAVELLREKYNIATKDDLISIINKYDELEEDMKNEE